MKRTEITLVLSIAAFVAACIALVFSITYRPDDGVDQRDFDRVVRVLQSDLQRHELELARLRAVQAAANTGKEGAR
jgi:hypothetical protein